MIGRCQTQTNLSTIYSAAGTIPKSFSKEFTKHNIKKRFHLTGIYPLNENILNVD